MCDGKPGAWPCLGANSAREVASCCSLKGTPKQKNFGCSKIQLVLNNAKFHSVGTLIQLQGYNGATIIAKCCSATFYLDRKSFHPALPVSQLWLMTFTFDGYLPLLHKTQVSEQIHRGLLPPCLPSPVHRDADLQKSALQEMLFIPRKLISSLFLNLLGYYHGYLLCLALIAQFQDAAASKHDCSKLLGSKLRFWVLNCLLTQSCSADLLPRLYCHYHVDWEFGGKQKVRQDHLGHSAQPPATTRGFIHRINTGVHKVFHLPLQSHDDTKAADTARQHEWAPPVEFYAANFAPEATVNLTS